MSDNQSNIFLPPRAPPSLTVAIQSDLPPSAGLGSSAAFSVCLAAGLLAHSGALSVSPPDPSRGINTPIKPHSATPGSLEASSGSLGASSGDGASMEGEGSGGLTEADLRLINDWAFVAERIIHGRPSGIDNSVSTYGECCVYYAQ